MTDTNHTERARDVLISRDAAIQACEDARAHAERHYGVAEGVGADMAKRRIEALASQAAQPAEADGVEPSAWMYTRNDGQYTFVEKNRWGVLSSEGPLGYVETPLYAATPKAPATDAGGMRDTFDGKMIHAVASLRAAISLLEKGGKKAAPSDKMFAQMLRDYHKAANAAAKALATPPAPNDDLRVALEAALCAPDWPTSLGHVHAAIAALEENRRG